MEIGTEISQKIRSAIKAKLIELGAYVDDELPDYIMVMVANKKSQKQMTADLSLFLGASTEKFTVWLHGLLKKLQSINTDETGSKHKTKEKPKGDKRKHHKATQGEKDKAAKSTGTDRQRKSSTTEKERTEKKKVEEKKKAEVKGETSTSAKPVQQEVVEEQKDVISISENTDEFNEENNEAEIKEQVKTSSTGKPPPSKGSRSSEVKKSSTKSSTKDSSKSKSSSSSRHKTESKEPHRKPSSFVANVKRRYEEIDEEEEYDPANPAVGSVASVIRGPQRKSSIPKSLQANKSLLMKAVTEAEKSVTTTKKTSPPAAVSESSMRSDRKPVDLKKRLKTAAGIGLMSRSKRTELEGLKHKITTTGSSEVEVKKPRRSSEGFENMKYTIKNESAAPQKKSPPKPKAPASAPSRVAVSAFREMGNVSKVVKKEVKEHSDSEQEDEEYGPALPDTRLVQKSRPDESSTDNTDSNSRDSPVDQIEEEDAADPEIQQLLDEAHESLDLNEDIQYEEDGRTVRDSQSESPEPKFIVTLDGVNPDAFKMYDEPKRNLVQTVKPVPKQKPIVEPQQQQFKPSVFQSMETTEQIFAKIAPTKIKPFNINLKDSDDEEEVEGMETEEAEAVKPVINERCRFWPACANGNNCQYIHPSIPCKTFPYCKFGDKCLYIHPNCRFDAKCTRMDCPFTHSSKRMGAMMAPTVIHKILQVPMQSYIPPVAAQYQQSSMAQPSQQCKFYPNCTNMSCPFTHPKPCRYGIGCMNKSTCTFYHPPLPGKDKLRWSSASKKDSSEKTAVASASTDASETKK